MEPPDDLVPGLRAQIASLESILADLKTELSRVENYYKKTAPSRADSEGHSQTQPNKSSPHHLGNHNGKTFESFVDQLDLLSEENCGRSWEMTAGEYRRYGRQLIMPEIGLGGQLRLKNASVLIVGVGGLGCPAATYLAGAGVGRIGLMDGDTVELSNLHRQLLHTEKELCISKVDSAVGNLIDRNSEIHYIAHPSDLDHETAVEVMRNYDLILDCTDRPTTRYLISDAAVLAGKPVVTASALRTEGQLMVLNNPPKRPDNPGGFCYRCVFPKPPPAEAVLSCGEGGILGPVVGVMGVLMAMEALKIFLPSSEENEYQNSVGASDDPVPPTLLLYSAYSNPPFRSIKLRGKRKGCTSCSDTATITEKSLRSTPSGYVELCASRSPEAPANTSRVSANEYGEVREANENPHILVDVREKVQFDICHLKGSINLPYSEISRDPEASLNRLDDATNDDRNIVNGIPLYLICRFGNDSQLAAKKFKGLTRFQADARYDLKGDISGGLKAWRESVDPGFPEY